VSKLATELAAEMQKTTNLTIRLDKIQSDLALFTKGNRLG